MDESSPLMQFPGMHGGTSELLGDQHAQFCNLVGTRPLNLAPDQSHTPHKESLYRRVKQHRAAQNRTYIFTATLTNTMLLSQVVLGAALTGLAASDQSRVLITVFGALNTVIAGMVAFLRARGQPMRARMFRDDLDRVVDEVENATVMWFGISKNAHGYGDIDVDEVTVRSEVARLTRLYDRAVKTNTLNDPDMYAAGGPADMHNAALRGRSAQPAPASMPTTTVPEAAGAADAGVAAVVAQTPVADPDESPATKAPEPPKPKLPEPEAPASASAPETLKPDTKDTANITSPETSAGSSSTTALPSESTAGADVHDQPDSGGDGTGKHSESVERA